MKPEDGLEVKTLEQAVLLTAIKCYSILQNEF